MKNKGRRLKYLEYKEEQEHREIFLKKLKKATTTLTSGSLVSHRQFCLSDNDYLLYAKQKQQDCDDKVLLKEKRRIRQSKNDEGRFLQTFKKLKSSTDLHRDDYKSLIKKSENQNR